MERPDFYLSSVDSIELSHHPRKCVVLKRIKRRHASDVMLIRVEPPLAARMAHGEHAYDRLIVAPHAQGETMFPISSWPLHVYVVRSGADDPEKLQFLEDAASEILFWGELYPTEEAVKQVRPL